MKLPAPIVALSKAKINNAPQSFAVHASVQNLMKR